MVPMQSTQKVKSPRQKLAKRPKFLDHFILGQLLGTVEKVMPPCPKCITMWASLLILLLEARENSWGVIHPTTITVGDRYVWLPEYSEIRMHQGLVVCSCKTPVSVTFGYVFRSIISPCTAARHISMALPTHRISVVASFSETWPCLCKGSGGYACTVSAVTL